MAEIVWTNETRRLGDLTPWENNPRQIRKPDADRLADSLARFGQVQTIAVDPDGKIIDGHQRKNVWAALDAYGPDHEVDVRVASRALTERERQRLAVYLHEGAVGEWNFDGIADWGVPVAELVDWGLDLEGLGWTDGEDSEASAQAEARQTLAERFVVPPFSVLDARQGYWQERKQAWLTLGIQSELGRGENALDISATLAGITDEEERAAWNKQRRESPRHKRERES